MVELLAPAGNYIKFLTALRFGADAVYLGGKDLSLRALSENFTDEEMEKAVNFAHERGKKVYVTVNIFARNGDIDKAAAFLSFLEKIRADAAIITDPGLIDLCRDVAPSLSIHLSTQANTLNYRAAEFWKKQGVDRIVLARELSVAEIAEIHSRCDVELEAFAHGAMCVSYSGRCLLSNYLNGRDANSGECVQACRWSYDIREHGKGEGYLGLEEDKRGTYILNSKDLNTIDCFPELIKAGVCSLKIEGRMKSEYYIATVVNAYRRAIDAYYKTGDGYDSDGAFRDELSATVHRDFTTAYLFGKDDNISLGNSQSKGAKEFAAVVLEANEGRDYAVIEMRNRFKKGDALEVLSPTGSFGKTIAADMTDEEGAPVEDAKLVCQRLRLYTDVPLEKGDFIRKNAK